MIKGDVQGLDVAQTWRLKLRTLTKSLINSNQGFMLNPSIYLV